MQRRWFYHTYTGFLFGLPAGEKFYGKPREVFLTADGRTPVSVAGLSWTVLRADHLVGLGSFSPFLQSSRSFWRVGSLLTGRVESEWPDPSDPTREI